MSGAGIARREDSGGAIEGFDFKARIVGKHVASAKALADIARFQFGIALEGQSRLGNVVMKAYVIE